MAQADRQRYEREKAAYKGPWKVASVKDPTAPKKPMSAFLAFGNERRRTIAEANPSMNGNEISCLLSKMWRECDADVKQAYRERERHQREEFRKRRAEWERQKRQREDESSETGSMASEVVQDTSSCMDTSSARASSSQIDETAQMEENEWLLFGQEELEKDSSSDTKPTPLAAAASTPACLHPRWPRAGWYTPFALDLPHDDSIVSQQAQIQPGRMDGATSFSMLPYDRNTKIGQIESQPSNKRFEDYSMDDILQDEELFEDFSPSEVKRYSVANKYPDY